MISKKTTDFFHYGRGGPQSLAKSGDEILNNENAKAEPLADAVKGTEGGHKPVHANNGSPFHEGRGAGRGVGSK